MVRLSDMFENIYYMRPEEIRLNFKFLGAGISRAVYAIDDYFVVKRATCMDGFDQCGLEKKIYENSGAKYKKYLCPVIWYRPGMLVMPRAVPFTDLSPNTLFNINSLGRGAGADLKRLSRKYNLLFEDILSSSSWGLLAGRPVLIDYGCTN